MSWYSSFKLGEESTKNVYVRELMALSFEQDAEGNALRRPLCVVDGKVVNVTEPLPDGDRVAAIKVLDPEVGKAAYGNRGEHGVVLISTKDVYKRQGDIHRFVEQRHGGEHLFAGDLLRFYIDLAIRVGSGRDRMVAGLDPRIAVVASPGARKQCSQRGDAAVDGCSFRFHNALVLMVGGNGVFSGRFCGRPPCPQPVPCVTVLCQGLRDMGVRFWGLFAARAERVVPKCRIIGPGSRLGSRLYGRRSR